MTSSHRHVLRFLGAPRTGVVSASCPGSTGNGLEGRYGDHATVVFHLEFDGGLASLTFLGSVEKRGFELVGPKLSCLCTVVAQQADGGAAVHGHTRMMPSEFIDGALAGLVGGQIHGRFFQEQRPCLAIGAEIPMERAGRRACACTMTAQVITVVFDLDRAPGRLALPVGATVALQGTSDYGGQNILTGARAVDRAERTESR